MKQTNYPILTVQLLALNNRYVYKLAPQLVSELLVSYVRVAGEKLHHSVLRAQPGDPA